MNHLIPRMIHPTSSYWGQPSREDVLVDDTHALMSARTLEELSEYSVTIPTGTYDGKMWKADKGGTWFLCWYFDEGFVPGRIRIGSRPIILVEP